MTEPAPEKKIIVDEDWKEQAQREKEMLAKALEEEQQPRRNRRQPPASFALLVSSLATEALIHLGEVEHPLNKQRQPDLPAAQFQIDLLEILAQKTKGNLTAEESHLLESLLFDLRMRFVEKAK